MSDPLRAMVENIAGRSWSICRARPDTPIMLRIELRDEAEARALGLFLLTAWAVDRPSDPESGGRSAETAAPPP